MPVVDLAFRFWVKRALWLAGRVTLGSKGAGCVCSVLLGGVVRATVPAAARGPVSFLR